MRWLCQVALAIGFGLTGSVASAQEPMHAEILRDTWGVPHIFSSTDRGAMFGLGYAAAQDRPYQMQFHLRVIQGRTAEFLGDIPLARRGDTSLSHDRKMRTFGFTRAAAATAAELDRTTRALLQAYADGVNAWFAENANQLPPLFEQTGLAPQTWTVEACILSWWQFAQFFATDGTRDLIAWRNRNDPRLPRGLPAPDDAVAVVQEADVDRRWLGDVHEFVRRNGLEDRQRNNPDVPRDWADRHPVSAPTEPPPSFSHAWVIGGRRSATGSAMLVSDPQTPVTHPSLLYEFHVQGATFNARGVGVPGCPIILIGFSEQVAWGMTALGADQADLFRLNTARREAEGYILDGEHRRYEQREEIILVRSGEPVTLVVRESHFGPVITEFAFAQPGEEVALRRVPLSMPEPSTFAAAFGMMRADNVVRFREALEGWAFPTANVVFGDRAGDIGYCCVGAIPVRPPFVEDRTGGSAHDGAESRNDWLGFVPGRLLPTVFNPRAGVLSSANHRPIASFYPLAIGISTGSSGDTVRSWRLRELLAGDAILTPEDVLAMQADTVNPARRDMVMLAEYLDSTAPGGGVLSPEARLAVEYLGSWTDAGGRMDLRIPGAELAGEIPTIFRLMGSDLALRFGGGESGLSRMLRTVADDLRRDPLARPPHGFVDFLDNALSQAWRSAHQKWGNNPGTWNQAARQAVRGRMNLMEGLHGFPTPDAMRALTVPDLFCVDGATIQSQRSQAYTQFVRLDSPDQSLALLPPGVSEHLAERSRAATLQLWERGQLRPAPLSRAAVERITAGITVVNRPAQSD